MDYHSKSILASLGFTPPTFEHTRPDPRGKEYGYYGVTVSYDDNGYPTYTVSKYDNNNMMKFAMTIDGDVHFTNWAYNLL